MISNQGALWEKQSSMTQDLAVPSHSEQKRWKSSEHRYLPLGTTAILLNIIHYQGTSLRVNILLATYLLLCLLTPPCRTTTSATNVSTFGSTYNSLIFSCCFKRNSSSVLKGGKCESTFIQSCSLAGHCKKERRHSCNTHCQSYNTPQNSETAKVSFQKIKAHVQVVLNVQNDPVFSEISMSPQI